MIESDKYTAFRDRLSLLEEKWREYQDWIADEGMPLVRRELPPDLQKVLGNVYQFPIQVPDLRKAGNDWVALLTQTQARVHTIPLESGEDAKKDIDETETWLTAFNNRMNKGRKVDHWNSEGQTYSGLAFHRFCYDLPGEPDDDDLEPYMARYSEEGKDEDVANAYATSLQNKDKARHDYFTEKFVDSVKLKPCDSLTVMFGPDLNDPGVYIEKATITYTEFSKLMTRDGKKMGLNELGEVYILGAGENPDHTRQAEAQKKKFTYYRENVRDPESGKWKCCEYVMDSSVIVDKGGEYGSLVQEYDIPFDYPEYLICPAGTENKHEQNPHLRFLPIIHDLQVHVHELNILLTLQMELALIEASGGGQYLSLKPGPNQEAIADLFRGDGYHVSEGAGSGTKKVWVDKTPSGDPNRLPAYPGDILALPSTYSINLNQRIQYLQSEAIPAAQVNRFLIGNISPEENAGATASNLAMQTQAASPIRDRHLSPQDEFWEQVDWRMIGLIRATDEGVERALQKSYPIPATGEEGPGVKPGDEIELSAFKLRRGFDISVFTKRELLQEELQIWARADADLERGRITLVEYYEKRGETDPLQHIKDLNLERHRASTWEQFAQDEMAERALLRQLMAGIAPPVAPPGVPSPEAAAAMGPDGGMAASGPAPPGPPTTVPQPRPMVSAPALDSGGGGSGSFV